MIDPDSVSASELTTIALHLKPEEKKEKLNEEWKDDERNSRRTKRKRK